MASSPFVLYEVRRKNRGASGEGYNARRQILP